MGMTCQNPRSRSGARSPSSFRPSRLPDIARSLLRPGVRPSIRQERPSVRHRSLLFAHFVCQVLHEACHVPGSGLLFDRKGFLLIKKTSIHPSRLPDTARSLSCPGVRPSIQHERPSILHRSLLFAHLVCQILHQACRVPGLGLLLNTKGFLFFT